MGVAAVLEIDDFSKANSVLQPVLRVNTEIGAPSLGDLMSLASRAFTHAVTMTSITHDTISHL